MLDNDDIWSKHAELSRKVHTRVVDSNPLERPPPPGWLQPRTRRVRGTRASAEPTTQRSASTAGGCTAQSGSAVPLATTRTGPCPGGRPSTPASSITSLRARTFPGPGRGSARHCCARHHWQARPPRGPAPCARGGSPPPRATHTLLSQPRAAKRPCHSLPPRQPVTRAIDWPNLPRSLGCRVAEPSTTRSDTGPDPGPNSLVSPP